MWAEKKRKRPHEWLEGVLRVLGLAPSTHISQINQKVIMGYGTVAVLTKKLDSVHEQIRVERAQIDVV
jgi:hypothetical protein